VAACAEVEVPKDFSEQRSWAGQCKAKNQRASSSNVWPFALIGLISAGGLCSLLAPVELGFVSAPTMDLGAGAGQPSRMLLWLQLPPSSLDGRAGRLPCNFKF